MALSCVVTISSLMPCCLRVSAKCLNLEPVVLGLQQVVRFVAEDVDGGGVLL